MMSYFPSKFPKGKGPPRKYFFDILNTLHPDYLGQVMGHAYKQRMTSEGEGMARESIKISQYWEEQLRAMPYLSREYLFIPICLNFILPLQRKTGRPSTYSSPVPNRPRLIGRERRWSSWAHSNSTRSPRKNLWPRPMKQRQTKFQAKILEAKVFYL